LSRLPRVFVFLVVRDHLLRKDREKKARVEHRSLTRCFDLVLRRV